MHNLTILQKNFIRHAVTAYEFQILEAIFDVPDDYADVPEWARNEVLDLLELLEEEDAPLPHGASTTTHIELIE